MIIIETHKPFDEYIKSLSRHAKKDWAYVQKHNKDVTYRRIEFDQALVESFMELWERQLIRGKTVTWAFPFNHIANLAAKGEILLFQAQTKDEILGLHFVQIRTGYIECHPPMYDKKYNKRYLAKYMWFNLIKYAIENQLPPLNMGGGVDNWREMIKRRDEFPNPKYKWIYVPEEVKNNPDKQPNYYIDENRCLREGNESDS